MASGNAPHSRTRWPLSLKMMADAVAIAPSPMIETFIKDRVADGGGIFDFRFANFDWKGARVLTRRR